MVSTKALGCLLVGGTARGQRARGSVWERRARAGGPWHLLSPVSGISWPHVGAPSWGPRARREPEPAATAGRVPRAVRETGVTGRRADHAKKHHHQSVFPVPWDRACAAGLGAALADHTGPLGQGHQRKPTDWSARQLPRPLPLRPGRQQLQAQPCAAVPPPPAHSRKGKDRRKDGVGARIPIL